jgi:hypothetical protein
MNVLLYFPNRKRAATMLAVTPVYAVMASIQIGNRMFEESMGDEYSWQLLNCYWIVFYVHTS